MARRRNVWLRSPRLVLALVVAGYLIVRAVAEPFTLDFGDPASYRNDWGGPTLAGVLAVHMGPGIVAAGALVYALVTGRRPRRRGPRPPRPR